MPLRMTTEQYNQAVELWNTGKSTLDIAIVLGLGIYQMHPITRAATREAMRMKDAKEDPSKPVVLTPIT